MIQYRKGLAAGVLFFAIFLANGGAEAQSKKLWADGKLGLSFLTGGGSSSGLLLGGAVDIPIDKNLFARPELNITTHGGTPIEIAGELKYLLDVQSKQVFYVEGGLGLWFYSGGSAVGLDFTGGTLFPLSGSSLIIPAELRLGPIFQSGNTVFQIALTSGIRFSIQ
jgi:hypothetical protein